MSRSPLGTVPEEGSDYISSFIELAHRIRAGASFSGRERNCAFLNVGGRGFADASAALDLDLEQDSRGLGFCDWDHDGDLDMWLTNRGAPKLQLIQNQNAVGDRQSVAFLLEGDPKLRCPRDAAGARVVIATPSGRRTRTLHLGDGFVSQSSRWLHFGLGGEAKIDAVTVHWPGGRVEEFSGVGVAGRFHLKQGAGVALPASDLGLKPLAIKSLKIPETTETSRVWLSEPAALPSEIGLPPLPEGAFILSLWASWCAPCMAELSEYGAAGDIPVLPINVENVEDPAAISEARARDLLRVAGISQAGSFADAPLIEGLNTFIRDRIYGHRSLPLPTSLLIDSERKVRAIYRGRFDVEVIRGDLAAAAGEFDDRNAAVPFPGRWSTEYFETSPLEVAGAYREGGYLEDARAYLERFLVEAGGEGEAARRRMADLHQGIGVIDQLEGDHAAAVERFRRTLASGPDNVAVNIQLILSLAEGGRVAEALDGVNVLRAAKPGDENFLNLEADVHRAGGDDAKAIAGYRQVLAVNKRYIPAIVALSELLATTPDAELRDGAEAVQLAEFLAGAPGARGNSRFVIALADAYAEAGAFDKALREARRARLLLEPYGDDESLEEIDGRIALFEQKKPYHVEAR